MIRTSPSCSLKGTAQKTQDEDEALNIIRALRLSKYSELSFQRTLKLKDQKE